jgi:2'-5' RNA ligase
MIRTESFAASTEDFAAARKKVLADADAALRPAVKEALGRIGLPSWEYQIVNAAKDLFTQMATAEIDAWSQVMDDLRDAFAHELGEALKQTKVAPNPEHQLNTVTGWVATMSHNAAMEAAATADTSAEVGLEWVTMADADVRSAHAAAAGQTVPSGQEFSVGGEKVLYPGQPVGDPSNWINCRCVVRPTMVGDFTGATLTAAANPEQVFTSACIVALPAEADPVAAASSEADGAHCTLLFFGDIAALDQKALAAGLENFITHGQVTPITDAVNGSAVLGPNKADVVLIDGANLGAIRSGLLEQNTLLAAYDAVEQFPNWIPHVTLGYPETPRLADYAGEAITFDRLALWFGEDRTAIYPLGGTPVSDTAPAPEAVAAAVEDAKPAAPAPAAEAPAAPADPILSAPEGENLRPWHGVLAPEGSPSGDKRQFAERMLTTRDLPLPIKAMFADGQGHDGSVVVARIDSVYRDGGLIKASGVWDNTEDANRAYDLVDKKMWRGVSVDLDAAEGEMVQAAEEGGAESIQFTKGRISAATLCAIPAFAEAFVRNGTWEDFANEPMPTGAMVEIPDWPGETAPAAAPAFSLVASAAPTISADYFRNPMLEEPTPVTRGEDGHIFGHLGIWDACHIAYEVCTTVPPSMTDYAYFLTGQVFTDAGPVAVGQLTVGGGHADGKLGVRAAIAHYDNVASAVADITVGEDAHGVWFSGRIRPWATEQQIHELFAAGPSGDWRGVRYRGSDSMELVAAHAVNVQGFPVPRARFAMDGTRQVSLVAAGAIPPSASVTLTERLQTVNAIRASIRSQRFADLKTNLITTMKGH